jgi:hypothetical protein
MIHKSMNLRDAMSAAYDLGVTIRQGKGGEFVAQFPTGRPVVFNSRRKDTPRALIVRLRKLEQGIAL